MRWGSENVLPKPDLSPPRRVIRLPVASLLRTFCILHSAFCIQIFCAFAGQISPCPWVGKTACPHKWKELL